MAPQIDVEKSADSNTPSLFADPFMGFLLANRYQITDVIGTGAWGTVYKAKHISLDMHFAVKIVHKHHLNNENSIKRFEQEARALSRVENHHIVRIIDHGLSPAPFIVMEYVPGMPLSDWLNTNGPMPAQMATDMFLQISDALTAAEAIHMVHRDLKPSNILLNTTNNGEIHCKILDLGLAKFVDRNSVDEKVTLTGEVLGSPAYMSPEQWRGVSDNRSDIYSLGCIMYEVLAGKPAFSSEFGMGYMVKHVSENAPAISSVNPTANLPEGLEDIVNKCMQKTPAHRYKSSQDCYEDLKKLKAGNKPSINLLDKLRRITNKRISAGLCIALVLLSGAYFCNQSKKAKTEEPAAGTNTKSNEKQANSHNASLFKRAIARLSNEIEIRNWNTEQAAKFLGISNSDITAFVDCRTFPGKYTLDDLYRFLRVLKVTPSFPATLSKSEGLQMIHYYSKAIEHDRSNDLAYKYRSEVYNELGQYQNAIRDLSAGFAMTRDQKILACRAFVYLNACQPSLALNDADAWLRLSPRANCFNVRGKAYLQLKQYRKAADNFSEQVKKKPSNAAHYFHRALAYIGEGQVKNAIADWDRTLKIDPSFSNKVIRLNSPQEILNHQLANFGKEKEHFSSFVRTHENGEGIESSLDLKGY